jgi:hypothetical protein
MATLYGINARIYITNTADATGNGMTAGTSIHTNPFTSTTVILVTSCDKWEVDDTRLREALNQAARCIEEWNRHTSDVDADEYAKLEREHDDVHRPPVTAPLNDPHPTALPGLNDEHGPQWLPQGQAPTWQRPPP